MAAAHANLATALQRLGEPERAAQEQRRASLLKPEDAEGWFKLGRLAYQAGAMELAAPAFRATLRLDPGRGQAWFNLGIVLPLLGDDAGACAALTRAGPSAAALARRGRLRQHRPDLRRARCLDPAETVAEDALAVLAERDDEVAAARRSLRILTVLDPRAPGWLKRLALAHRRAGDWAAAAATFRRVVELTPEDDDAIDHADAAMRQLGQPGRAELRRTATPIYRAWVERYDTLTEADCDRIRANPDGPLLSVIAEPAQLADQLYPHWEAVRDASAARGSHLARLAPGDRLAPHALWLVAQALRAEPGLDLVYGDEDRLDAAGERYQPFFKPDWDPDLQQQCDYVGPFGFYRRDRAGAPARVRHLPFVLHHRSDGAPRPIRPWRPPLADRPRVSVIVPTRDQRPLLDRCLAGLARTRWPALEIIVVDNGSAPPIGGLAPGIRVIRDDRPFNYSRLNNQAVEAATGDLLCFMNNDVEPLDPGWLEAMAAHALRPDIGAVGARLLFPDGRLQHAGVVLGLGGVAGHAPMHIGRWDPGYHHYAELTRTVAAVTAACLVVRRAVFPGFDEALAVDFNDIDLCLRLSARGLRNLYCAEAVLTHRESASRGNFMTPAKRARWSREAALLGARWDLAGDPWYGPNLSLDEGLFLPAFPPRVARPWR